MEEDLLFVLWFLSWGRLLGLLCYWSGNWTPLGTYRGIQVVWKGTILKSIYALYQARSSAVLEEGLAS